MQILKYKIEVQHAKHGQPLPFILTPPGSQILSVGMLPDGLQTWVTVGNLDVPCTEPHYFAIVKTGESLPDALGDCRFMQTLQYMHGGKGGVPTIAVNHIFEVPAHLVGDVTKKIID